VTHIFLESHGVHLDVEVQDAGLLPVVERILPPGWQPSDRFPEDGHLTLAASGDHAYDVLLDGGPVATGVSADLAVQVLDAQLRARIALLAADRIFVHAGVVALGERAVVLPAPSFAGKSALVAALVRAGATYFSDEFAVLDQDGLVHPYAKPLSLRSEASRHGATTTVDALGGRAADGPAAVGVIAVTRYVPERRWAPERRSAGEGALALLANAVPARSRPAETMRAAGRAAAQAVVLEGPRGDADETAALLLAAIDA
jgi:hypothetical protein